MPGRHTVAVLAERIRVDVFFRKTRQDSAVGTLLRLVGKHAVDFACRALVVAVVVATVGTVVRNLTYKDRTLSPIRLGDFDNKNGFAFDLPENIVVAQKIEIDFLLASQTRS